MKKLYLILPLLFAAFLWNGCFDILIHYTVNANSTAGVRLAVTLDRDMLELFGGITSDTTPSGKKKPLHLTKHFIDSVRDEMFKSKDLQTLRAKKFITNVDVNAKQGDSSLMLYVDVGMTSYHYFDSVGEIMAILDSVKHATSSDSAVAPKSLRVLYESGDSIKFVIPQDPPKKEDRSHRTDTSAIADSITQAMKGLEAAMAQLVTFEFQFTAPNLLSHDDAAILDKRSNTVTWKMTAADLSSPKMGPQFVWFKKP